MKQRNDAARQKFDDARAAVKAVKEMERQAKLEVERVADESGAPVPELRSAKKRKLSQPTNH